MNYEEIIRELQIAGAKIEKAIYHLKRRCPTQDLDDEITKLKWAAQNDLPRTDRPPGEAWMLDDLPLKEREKVVGKWYKHPEMLSVEKSIVAYYQGKGVQTYGQWKDKGWIEKGALDWNIDGWKLAKDEEVEKVLIAEAKRRYAGKHIDRMPGESVYFDAIESLTFVPERNALCAIWGRWAMDIFIKGDWAKIAKAEKKAKIGNLDLCSKQDLIDFLDEIYKELKTRD